MQVEQKNNNNDKIDFLVADVAMNKAQLETGFRIVPIVHQFQDHKIAPTVIGHRASVTYTKMDDLDRKTITEHLEKQEKELTRLTAKRIVDISFDKKNEEKNNKK